MDHGQCEYCGKVGHLNESPDGFGLCDACADEEIRSWIETPFVTVQRHLGENTAQSSTPRGPRTTMKH